MIEQEAARRTPPPKKTQQNKNAPVLIMPAPYWPPAAATPSLAYAASYLYDALPPLTCPRVSIDTGDTTTLGAQ